MTTTGEPRTGRRAGPGWEERWLLPGELLADPEPDPGPEPGPGADRAAARPRRTGRDWLVDGALFAFATAVWAVLVATTGSRDYLPGWLTAVDIPLGAAACLAVWWRRRHPLLLALLAVPLQSLSVTAFGALTVVVHNLGLRVRRRAALAVLGLHLLAGVPYVLAFTLPHEGGWTTAAFVYAYILFFFAWGTGMRVRRQLVVRLRADARRERAEHARRLADARRAEREAIAREMHDVLAHRISLVSVHAGALAYRTGPAAPVPLEPERISDSARLIRDTAHQALEELRDVLTVLRGTAPDGQGAPQPGIDAIPGLVADAERAGQEVTLTRAYDEAAAAWLRGAVQRTAYRVVQEGLTNARRGTDGDRPQRPAARPRGGRHPRRRRGPDRTGGAGRAGRRLAPPRRHRRRHGVPADRHAAVGPRPGGREPLSPGRGPLTAPAAPGGVSRSCRRTGSCCRTGSRSRSPSRSRSRSAAAADAVRPAVRAAWPARESVRTWIPPPQRVVLPHHMASPARPPVNGARTARGGTPARPAGRAAPPRRRRVRTRRSAGPPRTRRRARPSPGRPSGARSTPRGRRTARSSGPAASRPPRSRCRGSTARPAGG
jgi:signal transduction histidine kinase